MKIVVTGCTGFVGREIVPQLVDAGAQVLLVGRDLDKINRLFPGIPVAAYHELAERGHGFDMVAHLAVLNNNTAAASDEFHRVNVEMAVEILKTARDAGITRLVYFSSMHALDEKNQGPYAKSKREARTALQNAGIDNVTLYLPAVYGEKWPGKLSILNIFPNIVADKLFIVLSAFKAVVNSKKIVDYLIENAPADANGEAFLYDDKDDNPVFRFIKRSLDLTFAIMTLCIFWWLLIALWVGVRIQSQGPGIFAQVRVGQFGRNFTCFKFRTMVNGTRQSGTHEISMNSVTTIGNVLRRTKLDELPQVWNILRNEISLVGPRPCLPVQAELVNRRKAAGVYAMKPGITGYAQINDVDMSDPARLTNYDARYKALRSLIFEIQILIWTFLGRGQGDRTGR